MTPPQKAVTFASGWDDSLPNGLVNEIHEVVSHKLEVMNPDDAASGFESDYIVEMHYRKVGRNYLRIHWNMISSQDSANVLRVELLEDTVPEFDTPDEEGDD